MSPVTRRLLYWTPRILAILFALFISIFAFDVFEGNPPLPRLLLGLFMHLIPTFVLIIALVLAWRWEWVGALIFGGLGVFYIVWSWGRFNWSAPVFIAGPALLVGLLFLLGWMYRRELRARG